MAIPLIPVLVGAYLGASVGSSIYSAYRNIQYQKGAMAENRRFWSEYERNTGVKPRFNYRSGYTYNTNSLYNSYSSAVRSWSPLVGFGYGQYQKSSGQYRADSHWSGDWMYA